MIGPSDFHGSAAEWLPRFIAYVQARLAREGSFQATVGELQEAANLPDDFYLEYLQAELEKPPFFSYSSDGVDRSDPRTSIRFQ